MNIATMKNSTTSEYQKPTSPSKTMIEKGQGTILKDEDPTGDETEFESQRINSTAFPLSLPHSPVNSPSSASTSSSPADAPTAKKTMDTIARTGKTGYAQLLLYNSFRATGKAEQGIQIFIDIHNRLLTLHGFMAGFQYIALDAQVDPRRSETMSKVVFGIRVIGLAMSFCGTLISLLTMEYLKSLIYESPDFQVQGIMYYYKFFLLSDQIAVAATYLLVVTVNLMCYGILPDFVCYIFHILSIMAGLFGGYKFKEMIIDRQRYGSGRFLYSDPLFIAKSGAVGKNTETMVSTKTKT